MKTFLDHVLSNAPEGVIVVGTDNKVKYCNHLGERICGAFPGKKMDTHDKCVYEEDYRPVEDNDHPITRALRGESFENLIIGSTKPNSEEQFWVSIRGGRMVVDGEIFAVLWFRDVTEMKNNDGRMQQLAYFDPLTGLPNRSLLIDRMQQIISRSDRNRTLMAVGYVDLDNFKPINDLHGHAAGDRVLIEAARRIQRELRPSDTVARIGGDEFVVILADVKTSREIDLVMTRLVNSLSKPIKLDKNTVTVSASAGVSVYPGDGNDIDSLLKHADIAMYEAKQSGKNRVHLFSEVGNQHSEEMRETRELIQRAMQNHDLSLHWQPKICLKTGNLVGAEALVRWRRENATILNSDQFIPIVEHEDMMIVLGDWIIHEAFNQINEWNQIGLHLICAVNIASKQIRDRGFLGHLIDISIEFPDVDTNQVEIEVVEETAMDDMELVHSMLNECKGLGFRISLDDFGTGYSSISHFRKLPIDSVKIDQSFIRDTLIDPEDRSIVDGIISISKAFGRETVAEGVECIETLNIVRNMGCDFAQGYIIARPMPAGEFVDWAKNHDPSKFV